MVRFRRLMTALFLLVSCTTRAWAWEADVHYGLVKWLAFQAGFSLTGAENIAAGSVSADETHVLAATYLVGEVCARRDVPKIVAVSRVVQQHHFPADDAVPGAPNTRRVDRGAHDQANGGNRWVRQEIAVRDKTLSPTVRLNRFGAALHPLGDSWSHAGEPDIPGQGRIECRDQFPVGVAAVRDTSQRQRFLHGAVQTGKCAPRLALADNRKGRARLEACWAGLER